jgi:dissimilatory sulfite reductase (desulfoviridin) alpha/beta subunit
MRADYNNTRPGLVERANRDHHNRPQACQAQKMPTSRHGVSGCPNKCESLSSQSVAIVAMGNNQQPTAHKKNSCPPNNYQW